MDIGSIDDGYISITLSRRNLEQLLVGLDQLEEATGEHPVALPMLVRMTGKGLLYVFGQPDEAHYADREAGPGLEPYLE